MNTTETLCQHIEKTTFADFTPEELWRAKIRILDALGIICAGRDFAGNQFMVDVIDEMGGKEEASIIGYGKKAPAAHAAMANSLILRSLDFEPVNAEGPNDTRTPAHITSVTVPTALATAEKYRATGKELLTALIIGDDLTCRVAMAGNANPFNSFWDNTGTFDAFGATVIAGRLMGLDQAQMCSAMGLVLNQMGSTIGNIYDHSMSFKFPGAVACRNSIFSAELAKKGFVAMKDPVCGKGGYYDCFSKGFEPEKLLGGLGEKFYADANIKAYPACRSTHATVEIANEIREKYQPDLHQIQRIVLHVAPPLVGSFVGGPLQITDTPQLEGTFSLKFTCVNGLVRGLIRPEHYAKELMEEAIMRELYDKYEMVGDMPAETYGVEGARLEVIMNDGTVYTAEEVVAGGDIVFKPLTDDQIFEKYFANVEYGGRVSRADAEKAKDFIFDLENQDDLSPLFAIFS